LKENGYYSTGSAIKKMVSLSLKEKADMVKLLLLLCSDAPMTPLDVPQPSLTTVSDLSLTIESSEETGEWAQSDDDQEEEWPTFPEQFTGPLKDCVKDCIMEELMPHLSQTLPCFIDKMIHDDFDCRKVE
jgi:hypothetical protein